jgi:hypothetical protein
MQLKIRVHRCTWLPRSRPSTEVRARTIAVVGDHPSCVARNRVDELTRATARLFTPTERPAGAFEPVTIGDSAIGGARVRRDETIRPSRDTVSRSWRGVRTARSVGEWMTFR